MIFILILSLLLLAVEGAQAMSANLTSWQHHRRQKRSLIYQNGGVVKLVTGCAFPVPFEEKKAWRQLVWLMNFHYQFNEPQTPIYWWNLWSSARQLEGPAPAPPPPPVLDEPQLLLFKFAENYMSQIGQNGTACLERLICENGQVHEHSGLYAQLLHRLLRPHRTLDDRYRDAYEMGRHGVDCRRAYPQASHCLLDAFVHLHERGPVQSFVSA
ncbi:uncharacterized protein LOC117579769 [Drosophila guanche]|uniref:Uncharacterized protein n=1 Tax=Drosophila guanche TaxID=7266 RepID=A0A3B0JQ66_DROGU|nr:uncharacterized protein LOC117579769 [Drosophila guanche]XP_034121725.1 uncharacterized protein LOC117579769 [Drosophila guanche]SPP73298.1 Hypothetical predicted protein [Drosophila guanche]